MLVLELPVNIGYQKICTFCILMLVLELPVGGGYQKNAYFALKSIFWILKPVGGERFSIYRFSPLAILENIANLSQDSSTVGTRF